MEKQEIKALIDKYNLYPRDDGVAVRLTKGITKEMAIRDVSPHKPEILAYWAEEKAKKEELYARRKATFEAIPGVLEIREARRHREEYAEAFEQMMKRGDGRMPNIEHLSDKEMEELKAKYPDAVFALEAEYRNYSSANYELASIWKSTYIDICDGKDMDTVKAEHDAKMKAFTDKHIWD